MLSFLSKRLLTIQNRQFSSRLTKFKAQSQKQLLLPLNPCNADTGFLERRGRFGDPLQEKRRNPPPITFKNYQ